MTRHFCDFGHIDLWVARQAPELVWQPILDWIVAHDHPGHANSVARVQ